MPRKNLIAVACVSALLALGYANPHKPQTLAPAAGKTAPPTAASLPGSPKPLVRPIPRTPPAPQPAARTAPTPLPATTIRANVISQGNSYLVSRDTAADPVPLFRQAIVLANVRAAVAGLPAQPKAEFRRGLLTLTFLDGTQPEIAAAINRALSVPEVTKLRATLPPDSSL